VEFQVCERQWYTRAFAQDAVDKILRHKPEFLQGDNFLNYIYEEIANDTNERETLSFVQFTDLHLDLDYTTGASTTCDTVMCCRPENGFPEDPSIQAGEFGSVAFCDVPPSVLYKMGDKVNELAPDVLFWTGDVPPHDLWEYSYDHVKRYVGFLSEYMHANLNQWSIFPMEGNHDYGAMNSQDFSTPHPDPMITFQLEQWSDWLDEDAQKEYAVHGYYSQPLKTSDGTVFPKVRVVAVNTEACYNMNFYLMKLRDDPGDQLQWLEETLYKMEANGEIGILIGHVPPADASCLNQWATRYTALMDRFQHIIRLQFFGHVHMEMHNTIRGFNTNKPIGINFWAGAMTTYTFAYPSFRRFIVDKETMLPLKVETWKFDPEAENPEFFYDHEMTEYYGMTDLSPASFDALADRFLDDEDLSLVYLRTKSQNGKKKVESCDEDCRLEVYCQTRNGVYNDKLLCQNQDIHSWVHDPINTLMETTSDPWYASHKYPHFTQ